MVTKERKALECNERLIELRKRHDNLVLLLENMGQIEEPKTDYERIQKKYLFKNGGIGPRTIMSEAIQSANNISIGFFVNNNRKAVEPVTGWVDELNGYAVVDYKIADKYENMIYYLRTFFQHFNNNTGVEMVDEVENILRRTVRIKKEVNNCDVDYTESDRYVYTRLMDECIYTIENNKQHDIELSMWL